MKNILDKLTNKERKLALSMTSSVCPIKVESGSLVYGNPEVFFKFYKENNSHLDSERKKLLLKMIKINSKR